MYSWINNCILGLYDLYATKDVYELYDCIEIKITKLDKQSILLQGNEAYYCRNYFGNEIVFIRNDLNIEYEKFVLAHELGHAILHTNIFTVAYNNCLTNRDKIEIQADYFAIKLLEIDINSIEYDGFTIEQIASALNLPIRCLKIFRKDE
ncbi:ImmA/IrrE family metallo-endopeptidase (plasmid) [Crassaminicella thermophila]|uniref:ImmA/IrrE family metallo-endopeptidase n=1 Tax=Crassaminicella thermophila TaxID=2599308 RepID=A0A5C0SK55_CRATE|nr:ImmA/IrrE family metallo-endopeptidase [Crassaminicella thermophila]QEK13744.1 ImmA/IrrE family metallo-endopeptidase [Crassaminicella thermophila]